MGTSTYCSDVRDRAGSRWKRESTAGRKIGDLPAIANPKQRLKTSGDFRHFCDTYFPIVFHLAWSPDHLKIIDRIERSVLRGGLFALAMPRGSGKTSLAEVACIWALLNGHRNFVCLIGSDERAALVRRGNHLLQPFGPAGLRHPVV